MKESFWYDLLLAVISAILGAILGVIIPKLLKSEKKDSENRVDKQFIFTQIHIEQNQFINNKSVSGKTVVRNSSTGQGISWEEILVVLIGMLFLIYGFLKFESQITNVILIMAVLLESTFLTTSYVLTKRYYIDKSMRGMLIFNIFSTLCLPVFIVSYEEPFYKFICE